MTGFRIIVNKIEQGIALALDSLDYQGRNACHSRGEVMLRWVSTPSVCLAALVVWMSCMAVESEARPFRVRMMPNGKQARCAACHIDPGDGGGADRVWTGGQ